MTEGDADGHKNEHSFWRIDMPGLTLRPGRLALAVVLAVVALQALLVPLFAAPNARIAPRHLPVIVAGPPPAADALVARLDASMPNGFDVTRATDAAAADGMLRDHHAYAAFV